MSDDKKPNAPIHTVRVGGVKATVWQNEGKDGTNFYSTTIVRCYRDDEGNWQETNRHFTDDLPKLELAAKKAYEFIHGHMAEHSTTREAANDQGSFANREENRRGATSSENAADQSIAG